MHHLDAGPRDGPARRARRDSPLSEKLGSLSVCANEKKPRATGRILAPSESGQKAINFTTSHRMEMKMCDAACLYSKMTTTENLIFSCATFSWDNF